LGFAGEASFKAEVDSSVSSLSTLDLAALCLAFLATFPLGRDDLSLRLMTGLLVVLCGDERDD
jgi:hypothetical protein